MEVSLDYSEGDIQPEGDVQLEGEEIVIAETQHEPAGNQGEEDKAVIEETQQQPATRKKDKKGRGHSEGSLDDMRVSVRAFYYIKHVSGTTLSMMTILSL